MGGHGSGNFARLDHIDFEELIKKSLVIQLRFFDDPSISDEKKVEYASRYLAKKVGERIELQIEHTLNQQQIEQLYQRITQHYLPNDTDHKS
jgi:hypothetical protein